jgi:zinc/manganese transport system substrate-binding protein
MSFEKCFFSFFVFFSLTFFAVAEASTIKVVTSIPALAWVVERVGGSEVSVDSLLRGSEDPHYVDAKPSFIKKVANADMLCFVGLSLEVGWLPKVLERAGNRKVQNGAPGYCDLGLSVEVLERPTTPVDRSHGHVHADGNPHWYLSLQSLAEASDGVVRFLSALRPEKSAYFKSRQIHLKQDIQRSIEESKAKLRSTPRLIEYHKEFSYLLRDLGINSKGTVEEKPGVPPSAAAIRRVRKMIEDQQVDLILATTAQSGALLRKVSDGTSAEVLQIEPMPSLQLDPLMYHQKIIELLLTTSGQKSDS